MAYILTPEEAEIYDKGHNEQWHEMKKNLPDEDVFHPDGFMIHTKKRPSLAGDSWEEMAKDMAYYNAISAAKKLYQQVEYFKGKESPRREEMIAAAENILKEHLLLLQQLTVEYAARHNGATVMPH
jgi:hypothetical protein